MKKKPSTFSHKLAFWSFVASIIFIFLGMFEEFAYNGVSFKLKAVSAEIILFLLTPAFGLYGFRRYTIAKYYRKELDDTNGE